VIEEESSSEEENVDLNVRLEELNVSTNCLSEFPEDVINLSTLKYPYVLSE
jgi:hypothetical protein